MCSRRILLLVPVLAFAPWLAVSATDFLRGDANADGEVTISDSHAMLSYLFRGLQPPECLRTLEVNGDAKINITDPIYNLNHIFRGGPPPADPFPEIGPAPDDAPDAEIACEAYEVLPRLEDPSARMEILEAVAPGGEDPLVSVIIAVSSTWDLAGLAGGLIVDTDIVGSVQSTGNDLTGAFDGGFNTVSLEGGTVKFGMLVTLVGMASIPPGEGAEAFEITLCLQDGTPAGDYPLVLTSGELVDHATGKAIVPELLSGTLTVLEEVAEGAGCSGPGGPGPIDCQDPLPVPDPLPDINAMYKIQGARAAPGSQVMLPFSIFADAEVQGYSLSVDFDESVLEATGVDVLFEKPDRSEYDFEIFSYDSADVEPGSTEVDEGFIVGAAVFSFVNNCNNMPAAREVPALGFHFQIRPEADVAATEVRFLDGARPPDGLPVMNKISAYGATIDPEVANTFIFINGLVDVLPEIIVFIRGDTDGNGQVDITDAQSILGFLFLGEGAPHCYDAADSNDDGDVNIADAIYTLSYLFLGGPAPPAPFPTEDADPTEDSMSCMRRE